MIYLDHNATSPYTPSVVDYIRNEMEHSWANPSSEYDVAQLLSNEISKVRSALADNLCSSVKSLIFTSGATESINTVLSVENLKSLKVKTIVSSPLEHRATVDRLKFLEANGFKIVMIPNSRNGILDIEAYERALEENDNCLSSFLWANNETGVINDVKSLFDIAKKYNGLIHIDGVQALGKISIDLDALDLDFCTFSGHKIGSLKGVGILYVKEVRKISPLLHGGGQERSIRPGTLNFSAIRSLGCALKDMDPSLNNKILSLRTTIESELSKKSFLVINCADAPRLSNTTSFRVQGQSGKALMNMLSSHNIYVSTGSACNSGSFEPSHVLKSLGLSKDEANSSLRVSLGFTNTADDVQTFLNCFDNVLRLNQNLSIEAF